MRKYRAADGPVVFREIRTGEEVAATRGVPMDEDCISPARHRAFSSPLELVDFIADLRRLSGGKPVGFKLCVGQPWEFMGIVKAMRERSVFT